MDLRTFLAFRCSLRGSSVFSLTAKEAAAWGIQYPLPKGWAEKNMSLPDEQATSLLKKTWPDFDPSASLVVKGKPEPRPVSIVPQSTSNALLVYTDGACRKNPGGLGGWGVFYRCARGEEHELFGGDPITTNNRMEIMATIKALQHFPSQTQLCIHTDSQYVINGITLWIQGWKMGGWKSKSKSPIKNQDLWMELEALTVGRKLEWIWVKGHAGNEGNERADELANKGCDLIKKRK